MKSCRLVLFLLGILLLWSEAFAQTYTKRGKIPMFVTTEINYQLSNWDTVFCVITDSSGTYVDSVAMARTTGRWYGNYDPSSLSGNYRVTYYGVYDSDTMGLIYEAWAVIETTAFHGAAAGLDTTQIREMLRYHWDKDSSDSWDMVDSLDQSIVANCAPVGEHRVIVWIKDIADSSGLEGFLVYFEDSVAGGYLGYKHTNSAGLCTVGLSDGSYAIFMKAPGWTITSPVYKTITSDQTLTYYATGITPSPPPVDSLCVVYGYVYELDGSPAIGAKVEVWMDKTGVTYHGILLDPKKHKVVYTDTTGRFEFSTGIYPNDCLLPANTRWSFKVTSRTGNTLYSKTAEVPVADSWEMTY